MDLRLESATVAGFAISGGGNGVTTTKLSWSKPPRVDRYDRSRAHGATDLTRFYGGRLYELTGLLRGADEATAMGLLDSFEAAVALATAPFEFQFQLAGRAEAEWANVRVDGGPDYGFSVDSRSLLVWALTLFAEDPRRYTLSQTTKSKTATGATTLADISATNGGNIDTPAVFTVTGPVSANYTISYGSAAIKINTALAAGHTLVIDTGARTVMLDGTTYHQDYIDPTVTVWGNLPAGANTISFSGSGMTSGTTKLQVTYYDARI